MKTMHSPPHPAMGKIWPILLTLSGLLFFGGTIATASTQLSNADCLLVCHSPENFVSLYRHHTYAGNGCATCHFWGVPQDEAPGNCTGCHYTGTIVYHAVDVTTAHEPFHDKTDIPSDFCASCHAGNVVDEHLNRPALTGDDGNLNCGGCHKSTDEGIINAILLGQGTDGQTVFCSDCHGFSMHGAAHDKTAFTGDEQDGTVCSACHYSVVTGSVSAEHIMRGFTCVTCHSSEDPAVQDAIELGSGENGQPVFCVDCHYQAQEPYDIHVEAHNSVCNTCHKLPVQDDGSLISIHELNTSFTVGCSECHRYGYTDLDKNTIFSVLVNGDPGEPPDYDYSASPYLSGPCLKCHTEKNLAMGGRKTTNCYPCHFATPYESWPDETNGYSGSETWGHNLRKRQ